MMKQLVKNARSASIVLFASTAIVLLGIFAVGCGGSDAVAPAVTSSFTATVNNTTGAVTFKNTSTNAAIYLWDLGDGTTSAQFEPAKTYQTGTYTVKLTASNTAGGTATSENTFTVTLPGPPVDTTKPVITLIGDATINLTIGDPYTDKGATANDNLDGNITSKIVKAGTVNTAVAGTYTITYDVTDLAGNTAVRVSRSVIVTAFDDGLLNNGAFSIVKGQAGDAWSGNGFNVINEGGTNFNFVNVATAGNAFDVNLSQVLPLVQGKNYKLTFEASSGVARTMVAGIGLSVDPWTNDTKVVNLTTAKQTITLDLSAASFGGANSRVIFDMGAAVGTVVIDNVKLVEFVPPCTTEASENINPANGDINWTFKTNTVVTPTFRFATTFDPFGAINSSIVTNPKIAGINTSCNVQRYTKTAACETWSGVGIELETAINWSTATKKAFKMKVLAETQVTQVTLRLERLPFPDTSPAYDRVASITQVGVWQELTFDFSDVTTGTSKSMIIYFDRDQPCDGDVYYFDDIIQVAGTGGGGGGTPGTEVTVNGDFETGNKNGWTEFPNGGATFTVSNAEANGGTFSGRLLAGEAQDVIIKQANLLAGSITNGKSVTVKFDLKGSLTGAGGVVFAEFFSEKTGGGTSKAEILGGGAPLAPTGTWTTYTYTTTTASVAQGDVGGGITLQLKAACGAVAGCSVTAFFDNVSIKVNP
ncbi:MAG: DUF5011 domain-containing protein [Flammeovirgaceae bacterium]|jgi:hypothetical protein|nr:DUF5011 domain-containing protein [Flammeovirgaceae bacterium]